MSEGAALPRAAPSQRRQKVSLFTSRWASQIGITVAFLLLWLAFVVLAPETFTAHRIYLAFAQTTPYFAVMAMALTMVIVAGDIDLFPMMALGTASRVWDTGTWSAVAALSWGGAGCSTASVTLIGIPSLVVTNGTQFPSWPGARAMAGKSWPSWSKATLTDVVGKPWHPHGVLVARPGDHPGLSPAQPPPPGPEHLRHR
jgi:ribose/xylose/arabinose/galactoside ABC-type transport system permease subunit